MQALDFAKVCHYRGFLKPAVNFYQKAFASEPQRAVTFDLHQAVCAEIQLSTKTRSPLAAKTARQQALEWLRLDLARVDKQLAVKGYDDARNWLNRWQSDETLKLVRDPEQLAKLPDDEKVAWTQYWADIQERSAKLLKPEPKEVSQ
ncbi:MAG: hypothetical protein ACJ8C4_05265 [Gemmataceae bacterium]